MTTHEHAEHVWFREQAATYLAGGLAGAELARFEAHAAACEDCATELTAARGAEARLSRLFEGARAPAGLEDRIIRRLRDRGARRRRLAISLHPAVRRAALAAAAIVVLGSAGYVANHALTGEGLPMQLADVGLPHFLDRYSTTPNAANTQVDLQVGGLRSDWYAGDVDADPERRSGERERFANYYAYQAPTNESAPPGGASGVAGAGGAPGITTGGGAFGLPGLSDEGKKLSLLYGDGHTDFKQNPMAGGEVRTRVEGSSSSDSGAPAPGFQPGTANEGAVVRGSVVESRSDASGKDAAPTVASGYFRPRELAQVTDGAAWDQQPSEPAYGWQLGRELEAIAQAPTSGERANQPAPGQAPAQGLSQPAPPPAADPAPPPAPAATTRKVIRNGELEFEVAGFDAALAQVMKIATEEGGYVATNNSEKLPNGKVKGTVVVRVPPDRLDVLVLKLRALGDLKSQKITAQDVTRQYTDLESELRAARAMEERLLRIIQEGKGEIKDLLAAEKELGNWRGKIEKVVGEMRYLDNLSALSTLSIAMFERDIKSAARTMETEVIDAGVEAEDVEAARAAALAAVEEAKGRVIQSELKRHDAGQLSAVVVAEVPPDAAGALLDRVKQLGKVARLDVRRQQTTPEGAAPPQPGTPVERADTRLSLSLYNLANVAPRETTTLHLAAPDVEAAYKAIAARVAKAGGRVVTSGLTRPQPQQTTANISAEVPAAEAEAVLAEVRGAGEVMRLTATENPDTANATAAKRGIVIQLVSAAAVPARESTNIQLAAEEVPQAYAALQEALRATGARVGTSQLNESVKDNVTAVLDFEIPREKLAEFDAAMSKAGDLTQRTTGRSNDAENTLDSKVRITVSLIDAERLPARQTTMLTVESSRGDVDIAAADLQARAIELGGRVLQSSFSQDGGRTVARLSIEVPLTRASDALAAVRSVGTVRQIESSRDPKAPDGRLAKARLELTLGSPEAIVGAGQGIWATIREGLSTSVAGLLWSLRLVVIGLCLVAPWALILWAGWRMLRRRPAEEAATAA